MGSANCAREPKPRKARRIQEGSGGWRNQEKPCRATNSQEEMSKARRSHEEQ